MSDLLKITDLTVDFDTSYGKLHAVRGVSIDIAPGESVGIVGESGSGKTVFSRATMGLCVDLRSIALDKSCLKEQKFLPLTASKFANTGAPRLP